MQEPVIFTTIDLARHADLCIQFRRDSYRCSFADWEQRFSQDNGEDGKGYLDWLRDRITELPEGCVHVWQNEQIVGQIEMRLRQQSRTGYVNLFYLVPEVRGTGLGDELQRYVSKTFRELGVDKAQLSASSSNGRAIAYYRKHGWQDLGSHPNYPGVHLLEKVFS